MNCLLSGLNSQIVDEVITKLPAALNSAELINFRRDEVIIREG